MLRLGIVDFDSSHSIEFTRRFNHAGVDADQRVDGARVVMGCARRSRMSPERVPEFVRQSASCGVDFVETPEQMRDHIDAALILSVCGSDHLSGARPFLEAGIPVFVDKPFACSLDDAEAMLTLAEQHGSLLYHSSALPFSEELLEFREQLVRLGAVLGAICYGPATRQEGNPGLFHYGIHSVELLFALMGVGCGSVGNDFTEEVEVVTGRWSDGRLGTIRGTRQGMTSYGFLAYCENGVVHRNVSTRFAYRNLCQSIIHAFESGSPPVSHEQNLEEIRFVLAALKSERNDGEHVAISSTFDV